jgi:uncharacterized protein (DUF362 family)
MKKDVSVVCYRSAQESVAEAIDLSGAFDKLSRGDNVFIKPNIVYWSRETPVPPWGMITTSRVVEDVVRELKDRGAGQITIGEGIITFDPKDRETSAHAYESLGYNELSKRFGVKIVNTFEREFRRKRLGDDVALNFSVDLLDSDFVVSLPVLKTHTQTVVSLSQKNLKGCLDINSRKRCHSDDRHKNLDFHVSMLADVLPKSCTLIDGIYTLERGPTYIGKALRSNLLIASEDMLLADIVGTALLGIDPGEVPHLVMACEKRGIAPSIESADVVGEPVEMWARPHKWDFPYNKDNSLPVYLEYMGVKGLSFPKYDHSLCTYCSGIIGIIQYAISKAWKKTPYDGVEILTGKMCSPNPGMNHTLLVGKCQIKLNKDNEQIRNPIPVPGCPPRLDKLVDGLREAGIDVDPDIFKDHELAPELFMKRYLNRPEFSWEFYKIEP